MTRSDLIKRLVAANPHLYARDIEGIVDTVFEQIVSALEHGYRVELRTFCGVLHTTTAGCPRRLRSPPSTSTSPAGPSSSRP